MAELFDINISESPSISLSKNGISPRSTSLAESIIIKMQDVFSDGSREFLILVGTIHLGENPLKTP